MRLQLTAAALERLIGEDVELELELKKSVCKKIVAKQFKDLADAELWRLSHGMTVSIAAEVGKVVEGFASGTKEPTGRQKWFIDYPMTQTVEKMVAEACQSYFKNLVTAEAAKVMEATQYREEALDRMIERKVREAVALATRAMVDTAVAAAVKVAVEEAQKSMPPIHMRLVQLKTVTTS